MAPLDPEDPLTLMPKSKPLTVDSILKREADFVQKQAPRVAKAKANSRRRRKQGFPIEALPALHELRDSLITRISRNVPRKQDKVEWVVKPEALAKATTYTKPSRTS